MANYNFATITADEALNFKATDTLTFAPGVKCNGNVLIEDHAYIGTGAVLKQGKPG